MILHIFFRVHVNEYWHFREILLSNRHFLGFKPKHSDTSYQGVTKQYYTLFSGFILKNSDTFTEILPYNSTHFFHSSFQTIHFQRDTTKHYILFVRVRIKPYRHFQRVTTKQYYIHFSSFISHNTFLVSYYRIIHIFSEFIWHNIETSRVTTKKVL